MRKTSLSRTAWDRIHSALCSLPYSVWRYRGAHHAPVGDADAACDIPLEVEEEDEEEDPEKTRR